MQRYDQTCCVTGTGLSHELGAVRLDGLCPDTEPHDARAQPTVQLPVTLEGLEFQP